MSKQANVKIGAFVLNNQSTYPWTVYPLIPDGKGGKVKTKLRVVFRHTSKDQRMAKMREYRDALKAQQKRPETDDDVDAVQEAVTFTRMLLDEAVVSFEGVVDGDGNPIDCTPENKALLLQNEWASSAIEEAYFKSLNGRDETGN